MGTTNSRFLETAEASSAKESDEITCDECRISIKGLRNFVRYKDPERNLSDVTCYYTTLKADLKCEFHIDDSKDSKETGSDVPIQPSQDRAEQRESSLLVKYTAIIQMTKLDMNPGASCMYNKKTEYRCTACISSYEDFEIMRARLGYERAFAIQHDRAIVYYQWKLHTHMLSNRNDDHPSTALLAIGPSFLVNVPKPKGKGEEGEKEQARDPSEEQCDTSFEADTSVESTSSIPGPSNIRSPTLSPAAVAASYAAGTAPHRNTYAHAAADSVASTSQGP